MSQELIEEILQDFAGSAHADELKRARDDYFAHLRDMREDDPSFEPLTQCFLDHYVLDRPLEAGTGTPLQTFAAKPDLSQEKRTACFRLASNIHSLFEVLRIGDLRVSLRDLFTLEELWVKERRQMPGLKRGDLMEARLLPMGEFLVFSNGAFVFHPRAARRVILRAVEASRMTGEPTPAALLRKLQALTFRYTDRYRERIPVDKIFGELQKG